MATYEQAWAGEQQLWMVCCATSAALACSTMLIEFKEATVLDNGLSFASRV